MAAMTGNVQLIISRSAAWQLFFAGFFFGMGVCQAVLLCTLLIKMIEAA